MKYGIDVSYAQGNIDWAKVAADPQVEFAMIRATATYPHDGKNGIDLKWEQNIKAATKTGLPLGVYHYSYATSVDEAIKEADHFLDTIKGYKFEYPVVLDFEDGSQTFLKPKEMADICLAWLERVESAGYYVMLYSMGSWLKHHLNDERLAKFDKWVAHVNVDNPMIQGNMWQYAWNGKIDGIGTFVDLNRCYKDYPTIIKNSGLNGFEKSVETVDYEQKYKSLVQKLKDLISEEAM